MKVLDAMFLIDYFDGTEDTAEYLLGHTDERFVFPVPAYAEVMLGIGNIPNGDVEAASSRLEWGTVEPVDGRTADIAATIADELAPQGPTLSGMDTLIAAVGRQLDAPVVTKDSDLTHPETRTVVDVKEYGVRATDARVRAVLL